MSVCGFDLDPGICREGRASGGMSETGFGPSWTFLMDGRSATVEWNGGVAALMPRPEHLSERVLGYAIHTNRELGLMLRGLKPLAMFADGHGHFPDVVLRYLRMFDRHVEMGMFVRREYVEISSNARRPLHVILYAAPNEAWRLDAMIELRLQGEWSVEHERTEGELLGYADWQNDIWINRLPNPA